MTAYSIGVDLGGTNLRAAAIDRSGGVIERLSVPAVYSSGRDCVVEAIVTLIRDIRSKVGPDGLRGVGIGVPGYIEMDKGIVLGAVNLPGFEDFPVRDEIQQRLGTPIILENDANAAALGESWLGAGRDVQDLVLLTLGTGIGGGIIVNGKVLHGSHGMAGEIGHMTVFPDGNPCGCGNTGCLEKHASATAIVGMARMLGLGDINLKSEDVYKLAMSGSVRARAVFECVGKALGIAVANLINLFNFPLYLLSGGPLPAWNIFAPPMFAELRKRSFTFTRTGTRVERAALGGDAGLFGAAYLPYQSAHPDEIKIQ